MGKQSQRSSFDKDCAINEFKNRWAIYFASDEGRRDCTCRGSFIVEVEKLCGDVFADCVNRTQAASPDWDCIRLAVDNEGCMLPIVFATIIDTAKARFPYFYRHQQWSLFKKHEKVLMLLASNDIPCLDAGITLRELGEVYDAGGFKPFDRTIPWIGVGIPREKEHLNFAYTVLSVGFDTGVSRIVVKVKDSLSQLVFGF